MKLSRETEIKIKYILEQIIPPIIRDSKIFMYLPFKLLFKKHGKIFWNFKTDAMKMDKKTYSNTYEIVDSVLFTKDTDLNQQCIKKIAKNIAGKTVLEVGCGKGLLSKKLSKKFKVTASDIEAKPTLLKNVTNIKYAQANIEKLPFKNKEFDTVICTHTLEHTQNLFQSINELRRVAKKRLVIVVPKERPYKQTFNLHLHFFPYPHSLLAIMGTNRDNHCEEIKGDLFYIEILSE